MKYTRGDMVKMRVPEREILDSPIYTNGMINTFKINPMVKITGSVINSYGLVYYIVDFRGNNRTVRAEWIDSNRGPVLFI